MTKTIERYHNLSLPIRATLWFTVSNIILKGISFFTVPLLSKILPMLDYGTVSIYNSYQQIFLIFSTFELYLGAFQRGILQYQDEQKKFTQNLIILSNLITFVFFLCTLILRKYFISVTNTNLFVLILMYVFFIVYPAFNCWLNNKRVNYLYVSAVTVTIVTTSVISFGSIIFTCLISKNAKTYIVTILIIQILCYLPFYIYELFPVTNIILQQRKEYWKYCINFQMPLVIHSLSYLILAQADRIMIGQMVGNERAAIYSVAYSLSSAVIIVQTSINQVFQPWRYKRLEQHNYKAIQKTTIWILLITGLFIFLFISIAPEVIRVLFSDEYFDATKIIPPISASVFFMMQYTIFTDIESYFYKTKYIMYASTICALFNIILNYFAIRLFGYIACAYTTLISYILFSILHYFFMNKVCKNSGIINNIFDKNILLIISVIYILIIFIMIIFYQYAIVRYSIFLIVLFTCFVIRKLILNANLHRL